MNVLVPVRVRWPSPILLKPWVPATTAPMVVGVLIDRLGLPPLVARFSDPPLPALTVQVCLVDEFKSSKSIVPIVREPSSVTVRSAARFKVLKSAAASVPVAGIPPLQLPPVPHEPPLALVQTADPGGGLINKVPGALVLPFATTV